MIRYKIACSYHGDFTGLGCSIDCNRETCRQYRVEYIVYKIQREECHQDNIPNTEHKRVNGEARQNSQDLPHCNSDLHSSMWNASEEGYKY